MIIRSEFPLVCVLSVGPLLVSTGCGRDRELTRMQGEVNRAATELVIQDAQARREWMETQKRLDEDRRQLAKELRRDPIIAQAILQIGGIGLCLLPLWLIARLLARGENDPVFDPIDDMVFNELIGHRTNLIPSYGPEQPPANKPEDTPADKPEQPQAAASPGRPLLEHHDLNALIDDRLGRRRG
ncbi:MAG TPA: hypothetical protein DDZ51_28340 [Planctomycetaceae bacterium]|nr:hypothetical protein [Planctomycetaceae bacterium]